MLCRIVQSKFDLNVWKSSRPKAAGKGSVNQESQSGTGGLHIYLIVPVLCFDEIYTERA